MCVEEPARRRSIGPAGPAALAGNGTDADLRRARYGMGPMIRFMIALFLFHSPRSCGSEAFAS